MTTNVAISVRLVKVQALCRTVGDHIFLGVDRWRWFPSWPSGDSRTKITARGEAYLQNCTPASCVSFTCQVTQVAPSKDPYTMLKASAQ